MHPPIKPNEEDCCNSGCNPCIFDIYEKQLKLYNKFLDSGKTSSVYEHTENAISQLEYTQFEVVENIQICNSHKLLKFKLLNAENKNVQWNPGQHFLFKYISDNIKCTRAYTPVNRLRATQENEFDFSIIVKVYGNGLVSKYLDGLAVGSLTLWRGPYGSYKYTSNKFERLVMIAQGTGIAPFMAIINAILSNEDDVTRILLLYCCKRENEIVFRTDLYSLREYWNFKYRIYLGEVTNNHSYKYQEPISNHKFCLEDIECLKPFSLKDQFLICGSNNFMTQYNLYLESCLAENIVLF